MLEQNKSKSFRKPKNNIALLSGVLVCGHCGRFMRPKQLNRVNKDDERVFHYLCETKEKSRRNLCDMKNINGNTLDKAVCEEIKKLSQDDSLFITQLKKAKNKFSDKSESYVKQIKELEKKVRVNNKSIKKLVNSLTDDENEKLTIKYINERIKELDEENKAFTNRIDELNNLSMEYNLSESDFEGLKELFSSFTKTFDLMTIEEKRSTIRTLVRRIVWDGDNIHIYFFGSDYDDSSFNPIITDIEDEKMLPLSEDSKRDTYAYEK